MARAADDRNWLLQALRIALHAGVLAALTLRSAQIGNALHPFARALANEWIHLLFYVETTKRVPVWDASSLRSRGNSGDGDSDAFELVPITLPHFLLEIEEEIAANVDDEFFHGGFAARASSYPVGMLFTINETKQHLHGAVANYFQLADVALDAYVLAGDATVVDIPFPELLVRFENGTETVDATYVLTGASEREWPEPLQRDHTSPHTRAFFDSLDAMKLQFTIGIKQRSDSDVPDSDDDDTKAKLFEWRVVFTYNLQSQGHLEVAMNYGLRQRMDDGSSDALEDLPPVFFDSSAVFSSALLVLVLAYECVECAIKWRSLPAASSGQGRSNCRTFACDAWFWGILSLNAATAACFAAAWRHPYELSLRDDLCLAFATCCALQWMSVVRYLRVSARFHILGLTLQRGLPRVAQFLAGVLPVFVGYVLFGTIMFGAHVPRFQSAGATATTLFAIANGDEIHDTFNDVAATPVVGQLYVYSYLLLFSYVVLMVCIGIIEDAFFSAVFPASWPSLDKTERDQAAAAAAAQKETEMEMATESCARDRENEEEDEPLLSRA